MIACPFVCGLDAFRPLSLGACELADASVSVLHIGKTVSNDLLLVSRIML